MILNIQNLAGILGAKLLSEPIISEICGFCFDERKIRAGECFFAPNLKSAKIAVNNGAYAIVGDIEPFDSEVAFLHCNDVDTAILRLLRYEISQKNIKIIFASKIQIALLNCLSGDFSLLPKSLAHAYFALKKSKQGEMIFAPNNKGLKNLSFDGCELGVINSIKSRSQSLFYSDFVFASRHYDLPLSPVFLPEFLGILDFFASVNFSEFALKDFRDFEYFKPLFVGVNNEPFGPSNRAFVCVNDEEILGLVFSYFNKKIEGDFVLALPKNMKKNKNFVNAKLIEFVSLSELKALSFRRFALVFCDYNELKEMLMPAKVIENTLF